MGIASGPKSIRALQEIRLEHRFQYPRHRSLQQAIFHRRDSERPRPCLARSLRYLHSAHRWCPIGPSLQAFAQFLNSCVQVLFKLLCRLTIHTACTPPESPATIALCGRLLSPSRFSTLSASGCVTGLNRFTCVTAWTSLCLRLTHVVTFMSPRLDSRWGGSSPFPGREFHPLEAPGLAWRTEKFLQVEIHHPAVSFGHVLLRLVHRLPRTAP